MENQMRVQYEYCEYTVLMLVEQQQWQDSDSDSVKQRETTVTMQW